MGDAGGTGGTDNNIDTKNAYAKAGFSTYNVASTNVDADADARNTSGTDEKVGNNTNNISKGQLSRVGETDKGGVGGTDIEAKIRVDRANKGDISGSKIEASKKFGIGAVVNTDNNANGSGKIID